MELLKTSEYPHYQSFDDIKTYVQRCKAQNHQGHELIFGNSSSEQETSGKKRNSEDKDDRSNTLKKIK